MQKNHLLIGAVVLAILGFGVYAPNAFLGPEVVAVKPEKGPAVQIVYATGSVEASVMVPISARNAARLIEMNVDEGSDVKKDDVLARLEDTDLQEALSEALAREEYAQKAHERIAKLLAGGSVTRRDFDQTHADWDAAKAAAQRLKAQADFMKLMAPADGTIVRRDGEIGQLVPAGQPVFFMSCCAPLRVSAEVDEEDIPLVQTGQKVLLRADAYPDQIFTGKVQSITPKGDSVTRSYRVRISLDDETPLKIGMTAEANIVTNEKQDALLIPRAAVNDNKVWLIKNGVLQKQHVKTGIRSIQQIEITEGLTPDDIVALKLDKKMKEGTSVRPKLQEQDKKDNADAKGRGRS